jgi:hypothetical protein
MFEFLENLRARPAHHRKAIAFGVSAIFTLFIFMGWSSTLNLSLNVQSESSDNNTVASLDQSSPPSTAVSSQSASLEGAVSPFNSIKESLGAMVLDFKNHLDFSKKDETVVDKVHNPVPGITVNPQDSK